MKEKDLAIEIARICRAYTACCADVEKRREQQVLREELNGLMAKGRERMSITEPGLLLALLDGYEVTREEGVLQAVLDVVSSQMAALAVSVEGVKLLAYCYHYVEEEVCAERTREMLDVLRRGGEEIEEVENLLKELLP